MAESDNRAEANDCSNFVEQVAQTIFESHGREKNESFIFGISGKWGEGKTYFLNQLKSKLERNNFVVVEINPWKFAYDRPAFLRHFLTQVAQKIPNGESLDDLRFETTSTKLSRWWIYVATAFVIIIMSIIIASYPKLFKIPLGWSIVGSILWNRIINSTIIKNIGQVKVILAYLFTAVMIPPFLQLMSVQKKKQSVSSLDEFNEKLDKLFAKAGEDLKFVIYVDDLDRVTPNIARQVLDTMRTFFTRGNLSFVVTGDHSVLERYIGEEILPNDDPSEKVEEGRRYLKKIFNIYWRMLPSSFKFLLRFLASG